MPDPQLPGRQQRLEDQSVYSYPQAEKSHYRIHRKGSRYNIQGPQGRIFSKYKSASVAGPRWEELTHTPWPYSSTAYESGLRLWELGLIPREQVGQTELPDNDLKPDEQQTALLSKTQARSDPQAKLKSEIPVGVQPVRQTEKKKKPGDRFSPSSPISLDVPQQKNDALSMPLALPAPRIDLERQERLIQMLRQDPRKLFDSSVQQALRNEIEYHRPYARRAETLLKVLAKYQKRQRGCRLVPVEPHEVLARHLAWQAQQGGEIATATV